MVDAATIHILFRCRSIVWCLPVTFISLQVGEDTDLGEYFYCIPTTEIKISIGLAKNQFPGNYFINGSCSFRKDFILVICMPCFAMYVSFHPRKSKIRYWIYGDVDLEAAHKTPAIFTILSRSLLPPDACPVPPCYYCSKTPIAALLIDAPTYRSTTSLYLLQQKKIFFFEPRR